MRPILFQLPVLTGFSVSQALSGSASCRCCRSPLDHAEPRFASVTTSGPTWRSARAHGGGLTWFGHSVPFWHLHSYNRGWASLSPLLPSSPCSPPPCPPLPQSTCYSFLVWFFWLSRGGSSPPPLRHCGSHCQLAPHFGTQSRNPVISSGAFVPGSRLHECNKALQPLCGPSRLLSGLDLEVQELHHGAVRNLAHTLTGTFFIATPHPSPHHSMGTQRSPKRLIQCRD